MKPLNTRRLPLAASIGAILGANLAAVPLAGAQEDEALEMEEIVVTGSLRSLPGEDVDVFGFGKSLLETPRSVSTISADQMERFNINDIDELIAFSPGTFTQSFFGVAGSLDIRGTAGETYFRGIRRVDNPGNYATPIAAADRVDIVRGPASPIYGPAKVGGYLNFNPKSARAGSGEYLDDTTGGLSYTTGRWDRQVVAGDIGGPISDNAGYYLYGEYEDSDSFYDNTATEQTILQAAFDVDLTDRLHIQFGAMYHDFLGNQVAGWNRLTQDLVDNGTYVTGTAQPLDSDGDGKISHQEYNATAAAGSDGQSISQFFLFPSFVSEDALNPLSALENPGTTTLSPSSVLVDPNDELDNQTLTLYFDAIFEMDDGLKITNQLFYESLENNNENAYGFSQGGETWVFEEKLIFAYDLDLAGVQSSLQFSPSVRHTDFERGNDFSNEYFDRRDLSQSAAERNPALDTRLLATQIDDDYDDYRFGDYTMWGLAFLGDFVWNNGLNVTVGLRQDWLDMESNSDLNRLQFPDEDLVAANPDGIYTEDDTDSITSWTVSASWATPLGLIPYATLSEQSTVVASQLGDLPVALVRDGTATDVSELMEFGVKGSYLNDSLYFAIAAYEQERTDFNAQDIVTNATTKTEGTEVEVRWVVTPQLVLTAAWTNVEVTMSTAVENGTQFSFFGADDMPQIDPALVYGGQAIGLIPVGGEGNVEGLKQGIPENVFSATATYDFANGLAVNASVVDVDSTYSSFSKVVELPAYTLVNAGISYETDSWRVSLSGKNLTDEAYFRANFTNLFGAQIVLPELPRHWVAKVDYRF